MARFFDSWATWEKLVFVLGCAIVITLILGCLKLAYSHWKLRIYIAVAAEQKKENGIQRSVSQRQRFPIEQEAEVPFGARAIEKGHQVEGVWNASGRNTPDSATRDTSASSLVRDRLPQKDRELDIERQGTFGSHTRSTSDPTTTDRQARAAAPVFGPFPSANVTSDPPPDSVNVRPLKKRYPPLSLSKFNNEAYPMRQGLAETALQGPDAVDTTSGPVHGHDTGQGRSESKDSSNQPSYESNECGPIAASAPSLLNHGRHSHSGSAEFDLMQSHRNSQAAETGQLTPRARRSGYSGECTSVNAEKFDYFDPSAEDALAAVADDPVADSTGHTSQASKADDFTNDAWPLSSSGVVPFPRFCRSGLLLSQHQTDQNYSRQLPATEGAQVFEPSRQSTRSTSIPPAVLLSPDLPSSQRAQSHTQPQSVPKRVSFEHGRTSDVLRGRNSGFEILKHGTLNAATCEPPMDRQRTSRPLSFLHGSAARSSSAESRRKLQKKSKPSSDSRSSSEARRLSLVGTA